MRRILFIIALILMNGSASSASSPSFHHILNVGVVSFRPIDENQRIWHPLIDEIHAFNPQLDVNLTSGSLEEIEKLVQNNTLDFVIVHPAAFIEMEYKFGITNIASIIRQTTADGQHLIRYGGVIITLSKKNDIQTLSDVRGKTIVTTHKEGTAAMLMQQEVLAKAGVDILHDCHMLYTGQPTDKVIETLRSGKADVAFVRTGYLEEMADKGKIKLNEFRVIAPQSDNGFPYLHSTPLYPEWAVASTTRPSNETVKEFTAALYSVHTDVSKDFHEFGIPLSYQSVRELMQKLHTYPFEPTPITLSDLIRQNSFIIMGILTFLVLSAVTTSWIFRRQTYQIRKQKDQIETILSTASDGIHVHDLDGKLLLFSDSFAEMLGYTREEAAQLSVFEWDHHFDPEKIKEMMQHLKMQKAKFETKHTRKDGSEIDVEIHSQGIMINDHYYIFASARDITQRKEADLTLLQHNTIFENIAEGVYAVDTQGICTYINAAGLNMLGLKSDEIVGNIPHSLFHFRHQDGVTYDQNLCPISEAVRGGHAAHVEEIFIRKNGTVFPVFVTVSPIIQDESVIGSVVTFIDITEQKVYNERLIEEKERYDHIAHHDPLTGLPNRLSLIEKLQLKTSGMEDHPFALFFLDLDGFKEINDSYGHRFGDTLLIHFKSLLQEMFPPETFIVRTGGDEFVILLGCQKDQKLIQSIMTKLVDILNYPFHINETDVYITASVGIAMYPNDALTPEDLLQHADAAMYNAKKMGKNTFSLYNTVLTENALYRTTIATNLKKALAAGALELYFQPQVDAYTSKIIGVETLLRWFSPDGPISPAIFIPIAEEMGLIQEIGEFVLRQGCMIASKWAETKLLNGRIAINVSARQLVHLDFLSTLEHIIQETQCDPSWVELEITESSILENPEKMIALLTVIKSKGFTISIDDFGTGYSSLSYLKNLPIDKLKIDISFIRNITHEPKNQTIVKTIIALAKGLGMTPLAEGVETADELAFLQLHGIGSIQGYYYYKPIPQKEIESILQH
ncbi:EAL domain-containing protein [Sulfuricurvum sp.]|uniref:EAL domain-containing protein n=1 Tax=Sulfuricurvum sp. TaxID=2025608 RepID=UPI002D72CC44|nr:EAL domain-containing protein [Sulfuricurvum sp.]HZF70674.1 EAL domain-containing protein [Sulfuricurvum sp.]